jgi:Protein of unknown function (DUF1353)
MYFLLEPISWSPDAGAQQLPAVTVPKGFVTDFASIPQIFWTILRPDGDYAYAAVIHDYLYWTQTGTRKEADLTMKAVMNEFSLSAPVVFTIYNAVRVGGHFAWDENRSLKSDGEKRMLAAYPKDPRITWEQWKKQPNVFGEQ